MLKQFFLLVSLLVNQAEDAYYTYRLTPYTFLPAIADRESRNNWNAINYNTNGTVDLGKWQLNTVTFMELNIHSNMPIPNESKFRADSTMQKKYLFNYIKRCETIFKQHNINPTNTHLYNSWGGIYHYINLLK